jgi:hypothetical protein
LLQKASGFSTDYFLKYPYIARRKSKAQHHYGWPRKALGTFPRNQMKYPWNVEVKFWCFACALFFSYGGVQKRLKRDKIILFWRNRIHLEAECMIYDGQQLYFNFVLPKKRFYRNDQLQIERIDLQHEISIMIHL